MGKTNRPYIMRAYGYWDPTADAARIANHPALAPLLLPRLPQAPDTTAAPSAAREDQGAHGALATGGASRSRGGCHDAELSPACACPVS